MSWPTTNQTTEQRKMTKIGDTVRFLNSVGGGKVVKIDGNLVYVEEWTITIFNYIDMIKVSI